MKQSVLSDGYAFMKEIITDMTELLEAGININDDSLHRASTIRGWLELEAARLRWSFEGAILKCVGYERSHLLGWSMRLP